MSLETQTIPIAFTQGVDTKTDPKQVGPGKLLALTNGFFQNPGEIRKRYGYTGLNKTVFGASDIATGISLSRYQSGLCLLDGTALYAYSPTETKWKAAVGSAPITSLAVQPAYLGGTGQVAGDSAYSGGLQAFVWDNGGSVSYSVIDATTGQTVVDITSIGETGASHPKVLPFQGRFVFIYSNASTSKLRFKTITVASPTLALSAATDIATDLNATTATAIFDAAVVNQKIYVAYNSTVPALKMPYIDSSFAVQAAVTVDTVATLAIGVFTDSANQVWVGYATSTLVKARVYTYAGSALTSATLVETVSNIRNITGAANTLVGGNTSAVFFYEYYSSPTVYVKSSYMTTSAVVTGGTIAIPTVGLASKAISYSGGWYVVGTYPSTYQPTYFLVQLAGDSQTISVAAKIAPLSAGGLTEYASMLPELNNISTNVYQFAYQSVVQSTAGAANTVTQRGLMSGQVTFGTTPVTTEFQNTLLVGGGSLLAYDGTSVVENNFHLFPEVISNTKGTGGSIATGTYSYVFTFEYLDNQGQLQRSAPSIPLSVVFGSGTNNDVTIVINTLQMTSKRALGTFTQNRATAVMYRTAANSSVYYRIDQKSITSAGVQTVSFADVYADASITSKEQLYTTGGEVDNSAPPAVLAMAPYKSRLIVIPADNRKSWWYSKKVVPGFPVEFSPFFVNPIDPRGGDITAVTQLDDKLLLFKQGSIFYTAGDGPAINGAGDDYLDPQILPADVGALSQSSVVVMPFGVMFQSTKGFCLIDRSLDIHYIGADVEAYNAYTVTSAVLVKDYNQVRFTMSNGICLVYDYYVKQWSVYSNHSAVASTLYGNQFTYLNSAGKVFQESTTLFTDDGAFVQLSLLTSHLAFAGLQGYQRVYAFEIIGAWQSAHNLTVSVAYDYASSYSQTATIQSPTSVVPYQYGVQTAIQKCEAIQVLIQDVNTGTPGESVRLSGINLLVGVKRGQNRLPASKTY